MTAFVFFIFKSVGEGKGWLYLINSLQKKNKKTHRQPPSCIVKFLQILYYETIEQIHFMVVKIESYVWEKNCNIWSQSLIPPPPSSKTTKEKPESNEYNWSTEFEGIKYKEPGLTTLAKNRETWLLPAFEVCLC
jgi:hypothetical protein